MSEQTIKRIEAVLTSALSAFKAADYNDKLNGVTSVLIELLRTNEHLSERDAFLECVRCFTEHVAQWPDKSAQRYADLKSHGATSPRPVAQPPDKSALRNAHLKPPHQRTQMKGKAAAYQGRQRLVAERAAMRKKSEEPES